MNRSNQGNPQTTIREQDSRYQRDLQHGNLIAMTNPATILTRNAYRLWIELKPAKMTDADWESVFAYQRTKDELELTQDYINDKLHDLQTIKTKAE